MSCNEGVLLVDKPVGTSSFFMVSILRRRLSQKKIGHAGTLDPFATGLLILLLGRPWTRVAGTFLNHDKEYDARIRLGASTDTFDCTGQIGPTSDFIPTQTQLETALRDFQGTQLQMPPMFSARKVGGKRLYNLARKGVTVEREARPIHIISTLTSYEYPYVNLHIHCSKGTYIRSIAHDLGEKLGCGAYVDELRRTRSGPFAVVDAISLPQIDTMDSDQIRTYLRREACP